MIAAVSVVLSVFAAILVVPAGYLLIQVLLGLRGSPGRPEAASTAMPDRVAVLVPAHDESDGVRPTLRDVRRELRAQDRLIVIADNCTDDTASVAAEEGAEVLPRDDPARRGKGYALAFGLNHLAQNPPDVVVMIDADCRVQEGSIAVLASQSFGAQLPAQSMNLMTAPAGEEARFAVAEFAWIVKNRIRPMGLRALGLPCQLTGTGMAFPWDVIRSVELASGNIVEDLKLGLDLTRNGYPPRFCPDALVLSEFPVSEAGVLSQRQRWERGSLAMLFGEVPRMAFDALRRWDGRYLMLVMDMAIPPIVLFSGLLVAALVVSLGFALWGGRYLPLELAVIAAAIFGCALLLSWFKFGRDILPIGLFPKLVGHVLAKTRIYKPAGGERQTWVRTDRGASRGDD